MISPRTAAGISMAKHTEKAFNETCCAYKDNHLTSPVDCVLRSFSSCPDRHQRQAFRPRGIREHWRNAVLASSTTASR